MSQVFSEPRHPNLSLKGALFTSCCRLTSCEVLSVDSMTRAFHDFSAGVQVLEKKCKEFQAGLAERNIGKTRKGRKMRPKFQGPRESKETKKDMSKL